MCCWLLPQLREDNDVWGASSNPDFTFTNTTYVCLFLTLQFFWNKADVTYYIKTHLAQGDEVEDTSSRSQSKTRAVTYFVWEESPPEYTVLRGKAGADTTLSLPLQF